MTSKTKNAELSTSSDSPERMVIRPPWALRAQSRAVLEATKDLTKDVARMEDGPMKTAEAEHLEALKDAYETLCTLERWRDADSVLRTQVAG